MKITLINKDDRGGGAAMACLRLFRALRAGHADVNLLVQDRSAPEEGVWSTVDSRFDKITSQYNFLYERLSFMLREREKSVRFAFSPANAGTKLAEKEIVKQSDILHLHWLNGGFVSTKGILKLLGLQKPVVWTLHDMWPFTGGCHYSGPCDHFLNECGNCFYLKRPHDQDLSHEGWIGKTAAYNNAKLTFIACSNWMREMAQKSSLLKEFEVVTIPNPIDTSTFCRKDDSAIRSRFGISSTAKVVLFGAANINHTRKGINYLIDALHSLKDDEQCPAGIQVVVFGKSKGFDFGRIPFPVTNLSILHSEQELTEVYSMADVFVLPSLEDNLPNMIMEALACETPVVAFNSGGIGDMIDHLENGYLAELQSVKDLANGIKYVLHSDTGALGQRARVKVLEDFSNEIVAARHLNLYERVMR